MTPLFGQPYDGMVEMLVFLGNPGKNYEETRHNAGRMVLHYLPGIEEVVWKEKFHGRYADFGGEGHRCRLLMPETFMNISGKSVLAAMAFFKISPEAILVVHDDIELPFGCLAWRKGGGLAGHKGLRSIKNALGTAAFRRLRIGIGRPAQGSVESWVLARFSPDEEAALPRILGAAGGQLQNIIAGQPGSHNDAEPMRVF